MDIDDHDFPLVRKNLNIISVLILVLAYTNAKLNSLSFLGIQIDLDAHRLYVAVFILYLYFIWRFLTKIPLRSGFWNDFIQYYIESDEGVKKEHNFKYYEKIFLAKNSRLKQALNTTDVTRLIATRIHRFPGNHLTQLRIIVAFQTDQVFGDNQSNNINEHHDFEVSKLFLTKKLVIFCLKYDKFGDYVFPLIPIFINTGFFLLKTEWQGGLYSLWLK